MESLPNCKTSSSSSGTDAMHSSIRPLIKLQSHNQANCSAKFHIFFHFVSQCSKFRILDDGDSEIFSILLLKFCEFVDGKWAETPNLHHEIQSWAFLAVPHVQWPPVVARFFSPLSRECVAEVLVQTPGWPIVWKKSAAIPLFSVII